MLGWVGGDVSGRAVGTGGRGGGEDDGLLLVALGGGGGRCEGMRGPVRDKDDGRL